MSYIEIKDESKIYQSGGEKIYANDHVNFAIEKGELAVILGTSGAGKSTILNILGGMDSSDEGQVIIDGVNIAELSAKELITYRRRDVGFVFQFYNLINNLTTKENVELASETVENALDPVEVLQNVGLGHRLIIFLTTFGENNNVWLLRVLSLRIPKSFSVMNQPEH